MILHLGFKKIAYLDGYEDSASVESILQAIACINRIGEG